MTRVHELIDPVTGLWDEELIHANFWDIDAERILQIPLPRLDTSDFVAWHYNKNGMFSVKSAYHIEWESQYGGKLRNEEHVGSAYTNLVWKNLWSLKVPAKLKFSCGAA